MYKKLGLPALLLGAVLMLFNPAAALAQGHGGGGRSAAAMGSPAADTHIPAEEATRIQAVAATRIRVEAIRAGEVTRGVARPLAAATAVVEEATMAAVEEVITVGAVMAGITAGAA